MPSTGRRPRVGYRTAPARRAEATPLPSDPSLVRIETEAAKNAAGVRALVLALPSLVERGFDGGTAALVEGVAVSAVHLVSSRQRNLSALTLPSYLYGLARAASAFGGTPAVVSAVKPWVRAFLPNADEGEVAASASTLAMVIGGCSWVVLPKLAALLTAGFGTARPPAATAQRPESQGRSRAPAAAKNKSARPARSQTLGPSSVSDWQPRRAEIQEAHEPIPELRAVEVQEPPGTPPTQALSPGASDLEALDRWLAAIPERGLGAETVRTCLERGHRIQDLMRLLRERLARDPADRSSRHALAEVLTSQGQYLAAHDELEQLIAAAPEDLSLRGAALRVQAAHLESVEGKDSRSVLGAARAFARAASRPEISPSAYGEARAAVWCALGLEAPAPGTRRADDLDALSEAFKDRQGWPFRPAPQLASEPKRGAASFTTIEPDGTSRQRIGEYVGIGARGTYVYEDENKSRSWVTQPRVENKDGGALARLPQGRRWEISDEPLARRFGELVDAPFLDGCSLSELANEFARTGYALFLGGGCVRRLVQGERIASTDVDLVGTAPLLQLQSRLERLCEQHPQCRLTVHPNLGVLSLKVEPKGRTLTGLDYVVMRAGGAYAPSRPLDGAGFSASPLILGPDPAYHARSLDFTMNTILFDIARGEVWDPTGLGLLDAQRGVLRLPSGDFVELNDMLFLRALKFLIANPKLRIEPETLSALQRNADVFEGRFLARLQRITPTFDSLEAAAGWREALVEALARCGREAHAIRVPSPTELFEATVVAVSPRSRIEP